MIAGLARIVGDVGLAEDLAQDAMVAALEQWPSEGIPRNPGAWLMGTAKHRAIDTLRRNARLREKQELMAKELEPSGGAPQEDVDAALDDPVGDDLLRLIFIACHPVLSTEARVALTLRLLGGLTTDEIAKGVPGPGANDRTAHRSGEADSGEGAGAVRGARAPGAGAAAFFGAWRLSTSCSMRGIRRQRARIGSGRRYVRRRCGLGRILAGLMPAEPEVHGLVGLMEIQASRTRARIGPGGAPVLLLDQNRALWDRLLINRGLSALQRAEQMGGARGPYALQAAIAACHARAPMAEDTDWERIADLYAVLAGVTPSPIVELNRAVAVSMAQGPEAGLRVVDRLAGEPVLQRYHLLPSVRGDLLRKLGRNDEAAEEFERAASLTRNEREKTLLYARAAECRSAEPTG